MEQSQEHMNNEMMGARNFTCSFCGKTLKSKTARDRHVKLHSGEKDHKCSVCGRAFSLKQYLKQHMSCHSGQKDFVCQICKRGFSRKNSLRAHIWTVHAQFKVIEN